MERVNPRARITVTSICCIYGVGVAIRVAFDTIDDLALWRVNHNSNSASHKTLAALLHAQASIGVHNLALHCVN